MMKIYIRRSGGIANISLEGEVDTKSLPEEVRHRAERLLGSKNLKSLSAARGSKRPDTYQYEIRVSEGEAFQAITLDETVADEELLDLLGALMSEIKRKRKSGSSRGDP